MNINFQLTWRKWVKLGLLLATAITIYVFSLFPALVETYYSVNLYPGIAATQRILTRHIPFSLGDLLYIFVVIWLMIKTVRGALLVYRKQYTRQLLFRFLYRL